MAWNSGLKFEARVKDRKIQLDSAEEMGSAFTPMELFLVSLAGCTAMDVKWILEKQRQKIDHFEIEVTGKRRDEDPKFYESINLEFIVSGKCVRRDAVERAIRLSKEKYCSVRAMIKDSIKLNVTYKIADGNKPEEKCAYPPTIS